MIMSSRQVIALGVLLAFAHVECLSQGQRRKQDEPDWLKEEYVSKKWPENQFLCKLANFDTRGLNSEQKRQKFLDFEADMKAELASNILVQVKSSSVTQTRQVDNWESGEGMGQVGSMSFEEQLELNVEAEFSSITRKFEKNKTYHVLVIIDRHETAEKLMVKTGYLLDQNIKSAKVALQRRRALNLQELQDGLQSSNRRMETAIWLDVNVRHLDEYAETQTAATELSGLIDELKLLKSEQEFRDTQGEIVRLIQDLNFLDALGSLERMEREYPGREELKELKNSLRQSYQQYVKSQCPLLSETECLQSLETYISYFPEDIIMQKELRTKRERWFNSKIDAVHLYIDNNQLSDARQLWEEVQARPAYSDDPKTKAAQKRLVKAEQDEFVEQLKIQAEDDPFAAWRNLERELRLDKTLINISDVQDLKKNIGRACRKTAIRNEKRSSPFGWAFSFESSFRSNGYVLNSQLATSDMTLYGGIRGYSIGAFRRNVPPEDVFMSTGGRKKDHSKGYGLAGIVIRYWDGSSFRAWENSDDPSLLGEEDLVAIGFAAVRSNFLELELGVQNELDNVQSPAPFEDSEFYVTAGMRIQLLKMASSRLYVRGGGTVFSDLSSSPRMHLDAGLGWSPMFGSKVENREAIVAKYN